MQQRKQFFVVLESLRGLSALMVVLYHMKPATLLSESHISRSGYFFVDFFFVLSGFVIFYNYQDRLIDLNSLKTFYIRRLKRLYPLHFYTLILTLVLAIFKLLLSNYIVFEEAPFKEDFLRSFLPQLFLLNSTPLFYDFDWNGQNWSISAELIAYILSGGLLFALRKKKKALMLSMIIIVVLSYSFFIFSGDYNIAKNFEFSFLRGFIGFFSGALICALYQRIKVLFGGKTIWSLLELFSVSAIILCLYYGRIIRDHYYLLIAVFSLSVLLFAFQRGVISSLLKASVFTRIGLWSYSIYLNHILVLRIMDVLFKKVLKIDSNYYIFIEIFTLVILVLYSKFTYNFIEKRFYKSTKKVA